MTHSHETDALIQAQAYLASIVESSHDAIISKSLDGRITSWNKSAERIFGYTADEAVGQLITLLIPDDRLHEETQIIRAIQAGERIASFETKRRRKDGNIIDISVTVSPIRDKNGVIIGASKIARDLSDLKKSEERLRANEDILLFAQEAGGIGVLVNPQFRVHAISEDLGGLCA